MTETDTMLAAHEIPNATESQLIAYIRSFPPENVFEAARAINWKFSRGRPSVESLILTWQAKYPHWVPYCAKTLSRLFPNGPVLRAPYSVPNEWQDDDASDDIPVKDDKPAIPETFAADFNLIKGDIRELQNRADTAHSEGITQRMKLAAVDHKVDSTLAKITALQGEIAELKKRAPIQITIGDITLPPIIGQHFNFPRFVKWLALGMNILLIGPAGTGKTTAALEFARIKGLAIHCQPLTMDAFGVFGYTSPEGRIIETEFSRAWKHGGVFLWDELSMSSADAIGALNAALANRLAPLPGVGTIPPHPDFYMIAGDNSDTGASLKFSARTVLDGATLDRFIRIDWPIDSAIEQSMLLGYSDWLACVRAVRNYIDTRELQHVGATPRAVINGAKALKSKAFSRLEILEDTMKKGVLADSWPDILTLREVTDFLKDAENAII